MCRLLNIDRDDFGASDHLVRDLGEEVVDRQLPLLNGRCPHHQDYGQPEVSIGMKHPSTRSKDTTGIWACSVTHSLDPYARRSATRSLMR